MSESAPTQISDTRVHARVENDDADRLAPGAKVGRYVVLSLEATGGMGVVYAAYDPDLKRKIALKLLRPDRAFSIERGELEQRLKREAQALARLAHPNVVAAYDVGGVDDQIFVAMEYVDGETLAAWLKREPRPYREVLRRLIAAGRGLEAAHEAGLVHRDFKPENVLLGSDGRVRVADFGLARTSSYPVEGKETEQELAAITAAGSVLGTLLYMAPEQLCGGEATSASDQFSFGVSLYYALYRQAPFFSGRLLEPPRGSGVPRRIFRAIARALSPSADERFPSMAALIAELERDPTAKLKRGAWIAGTLALAVIGAGLVQRFGDDRALCRGAEQKLAGVWDEPRKQAIERGLLATNVRYATVVFRGVREKFDRHAERWVEKHIEACEATRVHGEQTEEILSLRMSCLDARLREMRVLGDRLVEADQKTVENALNAALNLSELDQCANVDALTKTVSPPADPKKRARVDALAERLARTTSFKDTGRYAEALADARGLALEAKELAYRPLEAEAFYLAGVLAEEMGAFDEAAQHFEYAVFAAEAAPHDELAARSWTRLIYLVGHRLARHAEARKLEPRVLATLERLGGNAEREAAFLAATAMISADEGKYDDAERDLTKSLALYEKQFGTEDLRLIEPLRALSWIMMQRDTPDRAIEHQRRAMAIQQKVLSDDHPEVAATLESIAGTEYMTNDYAKAEADYQRALTVRRKVFGDEHPTIANTMHNLGLVYQWQARTEEAIDILRRASAMDQKLLGTDHPTTLTHLSTLASALQQGEKPAEAKTVIELVVSGLEKQYGREHPRIALALLTRALVRLDLKEYKAALDDAHASHAMSEKLLGADYNAGECLRTIARAESSLGKKREAVATLTKARASAIENEDDPGSIALTTSLLARAMWEAGTNKTAALAMLEESYRAMKADERQSTEAEDVEAWLAQHGVAFGKR